MNLDSSNIATWIVVLIAIVGAALVLLSAITTVDPALKLTFGSYIEKVGVAAGLLAVGRGLNKRTQP